MKRTYTSERLAQLLAIPETERSEAEWGEIAELEFAGTTATIHDPAIRAPRAPRMRRLASYPCPPPSIMVCNDWLSDNFRRPEKDFSPVVKTERKTA